MNLVIDDDDLFYGGESHGSSHVDLVYNFSLKGGIQTQYIVGYIDVSLLEGFHGQSVVSVSNVPNTSVHMHHMTLYVCPYKNRPLNELRLTGGMGDENCDFFMTSASKTEILFPPGISMKIPEESIWAMEVHFEYDGNRKTDCFVGIRLGMSPPRKNNAIIGRFEIGHNYIEIPPKTDKEFTFTISSGCLEHISGGVPMTIIKSFGHMHLTGNTFHAYQIRNNEIIREISIQKSYDFNRQIPSEMYAVIIPGDEIQVTCGYKNFQNFTVKGGLGTNDEMCLFVPVFFGSIDSNLNSVTCNPLTGFCTCGTSGDIARDNIETTKSSKHYGPPQFPNPIPFHKTKFNFCEIAIRDKIHLATLKYVPITSPFLLGTCFMIYIFGNIIRLCLSQSTVYQSKPEVKKRNRVVYGVNIIIFFLMFCGLAESFHPLFIETVEDMKEYDVNLLYGFRFSVLMTTSLYMWELFYRIDIKFELVLHHIFTLFITEFIVWCIVEDLELTYARIGWVLMLQIPLELPAFIALFTKGFIDTISSGYLFLFSSIFHFLTKLSIMIITLFWLFDSLEQNSFELSEISFHEWKGDPTMKTSATWVITIVVILLFLVQMVHVKTLFTIGTDLIAQSSNNISTSEIDTIPIYKGTFNNYLQSLKFMH